MSVRPLCGVLPAGRGCGGERTWESDEQDVGHNRSPTTFLPHLRHTSMAGGQTKSDSRTHASARHSLSQPVSHQLPFTPASDCPVVQVTDYIGYVCLGFVGIKDRFPFLRTLRLVLDGPFKRYSSIPRGCSILNIDFIHSENKVLFIRYLIGNNDDIRNM